jgi:hypothetical protein
MVVVISANGQDTNIDLNTPSRILVTIGLKQKEEELRSLVVQQKGFTGVIVVNVPIISRYCQMMIEFDSIANAKQAALNISSCAIYMCFKP